MKGGASIRKIVRIREHDEFLGKRYTWFKSDGSAMSHLDRFLMFEELIEM